MIYRTDAVLTEKQKKRLGLAEVETLEDMIQLLRSALSKEKDPERLHNWLTDIKEVKDVVEYLIQREDPNVKPWFNVDEEIEVSYADAARIVDEMKMIDKTPAK